MRAKSTPSNRATVSNNSDLTQSVGLLSEYSGGVNVQVSNNSDLTQSVGKGPYTETSQVLEFPIIPI